MHCFFPPGFPSRMSIPAARRFCLLLLTLAAVVTPSRARAAANCVELFDRATVVRCALQASMLVRAEQHGLRSIEGRRKSAGVVLPSNPVLTLGGGYPIEPAIDRRPWLWSATVSQELEVAGQRDARLSATGAEASMQRARLLAAQRESAGAALLDYFNVLAAEREVELAAQLTELADALRVVAVERAHSGLGSELDATLADAAAVRIEALRTAAQERVNSSLAALASRLGQTGAQGMRVAGELKPLLLTHLGSRELMRVALARRTELAIATAEHELYESRATLYRRLRVPNPTISIMVRNDWIGERTAGIGVGIPVPLPAPLGRDYAGEIAESTALAQRAKAQAESFRRAIIREVTIAAERVEASQRRVALYTPDRVAKVRAALGAIGAELRAGRLAPREALLTQQALVDVLLGDLEANRGLCLASVELAMATGMVIEEGTR